MNRFAVALLACLVAPVASLKLGAPACRRAVLAAGATSLAAPLLSGIAAPLPAYADANDDAMAAIAARSNAQAAAAAAQKKKQAEEGNFIGDVFGSIGTLVLVVGVVGIVGFTGNFLMGAMKDADSTGGINFDEA